MTITVLTLAFEEQVEREIRQLWEVLTANGVRQAGPARHPPHITLAAYDVENPYSARTVLRDVMTTWRAFRLQLDVLGIFPTTGTVFLAPRMTETLFGLHRYVIEHAVPHWGPGLYPQHLLPDVWAPHCTLVTRLEQADVPRAVELAMTHWREFEGLVDGIGVVVMGREDFLCRLPFTP